MKLLERLNVFKRLSIIEDFIESLRGWLKEYKNIVEYRFEAAEVRLSVLESKPWMDEIDHDRAELKALRRRVEWMEKYKQDRKLQVSDYDLTIVPDLDAKQIKE